MNLPVVNMKQTGQNITMLREQRGISVKQLQCMMGFATPQAIYKWQHGESLPTVDNLVALSAIFSVPIDAILITCTAAWQHRRSEELNPRFFHFLLVLGRSCSSSICLIRSLSFISNACAILQSVSTLAFLFPVSIIARWLRAMPDKPESTSCDIPRCVLSRPMICPAIL